MSVSYTHLISSNQSKYLQEAIITQRNDRYVVPVKSEHKNDVPGLVHDCLLYTSPVCAGGGCIGE